MRFLCFSLAGSDKVPGLYMFISSVSWKRQPRCLNIMFKSSVVDLILTGTARYPYCIILRNYFTTECNIHSHTGRTHAIHGRPSCPVCMRTSDAGLQQALVFFTHFVPFNGFSVSEMCMPGTSLTCKI